MTSKPESSGQVPDWYAREYWEWVDSEFDRWFDDEPALDQDPFEEPRG